MKNIGTRVRSLRESREWTQDDLARKSGLKRSHISLIENDERTPGATSLIKLAHALQASVDFLLGLTSDSAPRPLAPNHPSLADPRLRAIIQNWDDIPEKAKDALSGLTSAIAAKAKESDESVTQS